MVVPATEVVVGYDDGRLVPLGRVLDPLDKAADVLFALLHRRVVGVFVVRGELGVERDGGQGTSLMLARNSLSSLTCSLFWRVP